MDKVLRIQDFDKVILFDFALFFNYINILTCRSLLDPGNNQASLKKKEYIFTYYKGKLTPQEWKVQVLLYLWESPRESEHLVHHWAFPPGLQEATP